MSRTRRRRLVSAAAVAMATVALTVVLDSAQRRPEVDDASSAPAPSVGGPAEATSDEGSSPEPDGLTATGSRSPQALPQAGENGPARPDVNEPRALSITSLALDAVAIRPVGVEANGELEVPPPAEVGWYRYGSFPGSAGSSVLAGHVAYDGVRGAFVDLASLPVGATVEVVMADQATVSYVVSAVVVYDKDQLPLDDIFREHGSERLILITCGGDFDAEADSFQSNVVAYASRA